MTGTEYTEREEASLEESRRKGQGNTPVAVYDSFSILRPIKKRWSKSCGPSNSVLTRSG
jgi:hypothetical protein